MVEDPALPRLSVDDGLADMAAQLRIGHRRVGAERHQEVERRDALAELALEGLEHQRHRHRAGAVRYQDQDTPAVDRKPGQPFTGQPRDVLAGEIAVGHAVADHGLARLRPPMLHVHRSNATRARRSCQGASRLPGPDLFERRSPSRCDRVHGALRA